MLLPLVVACKKEAAEVPVSYCQYPSPATERGQRLNNVAVKVVRQSTHPTALLLQQVNGGVNLGTCNLPAEYLQEGLELYVSGFYLTWPGLENIDINPAPFEVVEARKK